MSTTSMAKNGSRSARNPRFSKVRQLPASAGGGAKERVVKPAPFVGALMRQRIQAAVDAVVFGRRS